MVFGWFSKKKQDNSTIKYKVVSRKEASDEYVKYGEDMANSNNLDKAIECFDKAIECRENYAKAWYNKGRALSMLGELKRSQDCFDKARKLDPLLYTKLKKIK